MPVGGQMRISSFDQNSKWMWLIADLNGFLYTWTALVGGGIFLLVGVYAITGFDAFSRIGVLLSLLSDTVGHRVMPWIVMFIISIPAFLVVFVFRYNFNVIGPRRQFSYLRSFLNWFLTGKD